MSTHRERHTQTHRYTETHTLCSTPGSGRREPGSVPRSPRSKSSQMSSRHRAGWWAERTRGAAFLHRHPFPGEGQDLSIPSCPRTEGHQEPVTHQTSHCEWRLYSLLRHLTCTISFSLMSVLQHLRLSSHCIKEKAEAQRGEAICSGHTTCRWYNKDSDSGDPLALPLFLPQCIHLRPGSSRDSPKQKLLFSPHSPPICLSFSPDVLLSRFPDFGPG